MQVKKSLTLSPHKNRKGLILAYFASLGIAAIIKLTGLDYSGYGSIYLVAVIARILYYLFVSSALLLLFDFAKIVFYEAKFLIKTRRRACAKNEKPTESEDEGEKGRY